MTNPAMIGAEVQPVLGRLDDRPQERAERDDRQQRTERVERGVRRVLRLGDEQVAEHEPGDDDRHVDDEHRAPPEVLEQEAAGDRSEADAERGHAGPDADGLAPLRGSVNTFVMIDSVAGMMNAPPMPISARVAISMVGRAGERRQRRADAEDGEADGEEAVAAEAVAEAAGGEQQAGEHEGVGVDDPLQLAGRGAEAALAGGWARVGKATLRIVLSSVITTG